MFANTFALKFHNCL